MSDELKIQVLSDLHLEIPLTLKNLPKIPVMAEVLVLAGDIGHPLKRDFRKFLKEMSEKYKKVFFVCGNHEFCATGSYKLEYYETKKVISKMCSEFKNVVFLDKSSYVYKGIKFIGCTLFSKIPKENEQSVKKHISDYKSMSINDNGKVIRFEVKHSQKIFEEEIKFIEKEIEDSKKKSEKLIIITHHAPLEECCHDKRGMKEIQCSWYTDLKHLMKPPMVAWIHGHTHYNRRNLNVGEVKIVSNQLGYKMKNKVATNWDPQFVLIVKL